MEVKTHLRKNQCSKSLKNFNDFMWVFLRGGGLVAFYRNTLIYNDVYVNFLHTNLSYTMASTSGGR